MGRKASEVHAVTTEENHRRKRLGQYFTGLGLGRVLAALAQADKASSILDPMTGTGDLLMASLAVGADPEVLAGIEIDRDAYEVCSQRSTRVQCLLGNAFSGDVLARLPLKQWDLVIANPPYVRYQSFAQRADVDDNDPLPNALEVRTALLNALTHFPALDTEDKRLFAAIISGYSGLADLALPSWLLCAGLVRVGGRLAIVVPESWLSRDYSSAARYLLSRWFEVEFVVEDGHASWFESAQVKTLLIVAKRVKRRKSAMAYPEGASFGHITLSQGAGDENSPIGQLQLPRRGRLDGLEAVFAHHARQWLKNGSVHSTGALKMALVSAKATAANVLASSREQRWFAAMDERSAVAEDHAWLPDAVRAWLLRYAKTPRFVSFESQGIAIGQGLRTGANDFFYADGQREGEQIRLRFTGVLSGLTAVVAPDLVKPVLRRQAELPAGYVISPSALQGWVLDLRRSILPEEGKAADPNAHSHQAMPDAMAKVVRAAAKANFGTTEKPTKVWELTAVAPNIRSGGRGGPRRYWYMLPDFAPRHQPDLVLARVNASTPTVYLNEGRACVVDANFSAMCILPSSEWTGYALLAYMSSAWARALMECTGAVMGGGALKLEATHVRRLPMPELAASQIAQLGKLGAKLAVLSAREGNASIIGKIDDIVRQALGCDGQGVEQLREIARMRQHQRSKHRKKRGDHDGGGDL